VFSKVLFYGFLLLPPFLRRIHEKLNKVFLNDPNPKMKKFSMNPTKPKNFPQCIKTCIKNLHVDVGMCLCVLLNEVIVVMTENLLQSTKEIGNCSKNNKSSSTFCCSFYANYEIYISLFLLQTTEKKNIKTE
jgi:hypothetical protein